MSDYQLLLPKMGESVAEATIIKWLKNPGDYVEADEAVLEIATDKVDSEVPSPVAGTLVKQLFAEDHVVQVGSPIALIQTAGNAKKNTPAETQKPASTPAPVNAPGQPVTSFPAPAPQAAPVAAEAIPGIEQLQNKPSAAQTPQAAGNGSRFYSPLVKSIAAQENLSIAELDTIPGTGSEGRLTKDDLLTYIEHKKTSTPAKQAATSQRVQPAAAEQPGPQPAPVQQQPVEQQTLPPNIPPAPAGYTGQQPYIIQQFYGTQPFTGQGAQPKTDTPAPKGVSVGAGDEIIEMDRMRRMIADHMVNSKRTAPHVTSFIEADVTNLVQWREKAKKVFESREEVKLTFTPIFVEAVVHAIKAFPMINISVDGTNIVKRKNINIGMATALPTGNLIVPVIKKADELSLIGLAKAVNDLADRARRNKLQPDEVKDGTFTITNVGTFGNVMGTPIINQPQVAILALGAIKKKPAVVETPSGDVIAIRHMMFLSLSYDHRVVDGALGGAFIKKVADYLEKWDVNTDI